MSRERARTEEIRPEIDDRTASLMRAQERAREIVIDNRMSPNDPLYFPPEKIPYGWEYKWVMFAVMGENQDDYLRAQFYKGWSPVPADRHPEEAKTHLMSHDIHSQGNTIRRKGLILCEIPKVVADQLRDQRDKEQRDVMKTLSSAIEHIPQDPTIPSSVLQNSDDVTPNLGRTFGFS